MMSHPRLGAAGVVFVVLASTMATAGAATQAKHPVKNRRISLTYSVGPSFHSSTPVGSGQICPTSSGSESCPTITVKPGEKYLTLTSVDKSGTPTPIGLWEAQPDAQVDAAATEHFICGSVHNMAVHAGEAFMLSAYTASADASCKGVATTGSIAVRLSNAR